VKWLIAAVVLGACVSEEEFVRKTSLRRADHSSEAVSEAEAREAERTHQKELPELVRRDGLVLNREVLFEDLATVRRVSAFDFNCAEKKMTLKVLSLHTTYAHNDWPNVMGVVGCGKRARYRRGEDKELSQGWKLDGAIADDESESD
jgi:hypothetical protein